MVVDSREGTEGEQKLASSAAKMVADLQRLRGLRLSVRETSDGLGIHIPPARNLLAVSFMSLWLVGWAAGEHFALSEMFGNGVSIPGLFLLVWLVPWTIGGIAVLWVIIWQLFGVERLYFTAGALVRQWSALGIGRTRVVDGTEIVSVLVDRGGGNDLAGFGVIKVKTTGRTMRIGSGLDRYEADLVAAVINEAVADARAASGDPAGRDR